MQLAAPLIEKTTEELSEGEAGELDRTEAPRNPLKAGGR